MRRLGLVSTLALGLLATGLAHAGNEAHPRTPVLWPDGECGRVIDRSVEPIAHFEYSIPFEDTLLGPDELVDSRTHQFFALCRQRPVSELLPNWISDDDVARATEAGLIEPGSVPTSEVLDTHATWSDCAVRITADDDRRPISFAAAQAGFDWDLADVPIGVWQVAGYTFEPPLDLWRERPGFVKIVDDPSDPDQDLPAAAIASADPLWMISGQLELCVDVLTPATAILEWTPFAPELDWQPLGESTITQDGTVTLSFDGPPVEIGESIQGMIRVRVIDALGREVIAEHSTTVSFYTCVGHCGPDDPRPDQPPDEDPIIVDDGCACASSPSGAPGSASLLAWLPLVIAGMARRTRRRFCSP